MKKITALVAQEKNKKRVNVFLDGEFYCGMNLFTVMSNRLKVGDEVDEKKLSEISDEDNYSTALDLALNYISRAMHTKMQMIIYLKKKGFDGKTIARVITSSRNTITSTTRSTLKNTPPKRRARRASAK